MNSDHWSVLVTEQLEGVVPQEEGAGQWEEGVVLVKGPPWVEGTPGVPPQCVRRSLAGVPGLGRGNGRELPLVPRSPAPALAVLLARRRRRGPRDHSSLMLVLTGGEGQR